MDREIPFRLRGDDGVVRVSVAVNERPERWGYDHLRLPFESREAVGFPVCKASTQFAAEGYSSYLGWVQLVRGTAEPPDDRDFFILDLPPMFGALALPFGSFGPSPCLFDAPSIDDRHGHFDWVAHTFLCSSPTCLMTPTVGAVLGFSWGYEIRDGESPWLPLAMSPQRIGGRTSHSCANAAPAGASCPASRTSSSRRRDCKCP